MHETGTALRPPPRETADADRRRRWRLRDLRLRKRLILLVLVPLIAGVALASARVVSEAAVIQSDNDLNGQARVALSLAGLVYSVEDERDTVELYLTDGEQASDMAALTKAEAATQARITDFEAAEQAYGSALDVLAPSVQTLREQAVARLGDLDTLRASITSLGASRPIYQAYNTIVGDLLSFSGQLSTNTTDHDLASYISTLSLVEQAGEQSSQERGYLVGILGGGGELLVQQMDLVQAQAQYASTVSQINAQSPAAIVDLYQAQVGGDQTGAADSTVQQAVDAALQGFPVSQIPINDTTAYADTTAKVNQIRGIESVVGQDILDRSAALIGSARDDLYLNLGIIVAVLLLAFLATAAIARSITRPLLLLRTSALEIAGVRLPAVIERLRDPKQAQSRIDVEPIAIDSADEIGSVARAFDEVHHAAVHLASEQALLRASVNAVFTNLSRRSQTLVERQLQLIDDLESGEREPGRLAALFRLDHLATRMRRNNENLLVLAGEETARRWTEAVRLVDVARAAAAEVEQYERIILGEVPRVGIVGKAAPDVAHLVAELLENATAFSAPRTKVWIAARPADGGGVLMRIEDAGIGMRRDELDEANDRINNPPVVDVSVARRMGLYVVGRLAARYGIEVRLGESQVGGVAALIHLPAELLAATEGSALPGQSQVDDEFYALSRQFDQGPVQHPMAGPPRAAMLGESQHTAMPMPMAAWPESAGMRPGSAPWYDQRLTHRQLPEAEEPEPETAWFQPSEDRKGGDDGGKRSAAEAAIARAAAQTGPAGLGGLGLAPRDADGRSGPTVTGDSGEALPQRRQSPVPPSQGTQLPQVPRQYQRNQHQHHARPAPRAPEGTGAAEAEPPFERTPIFEAIESEWFRRREQARAAAAASASASTSATTNASAAAGARASQAANTSQASQASQTSNASGDAAAPSPTAGTAPGTEPAPTVSPAAVVRSWSSPGDDGWRAAQALSNPAVDGTTSSGLPKRTPRANLVPGRAGGSGAARAVPPRALRQDPSQSGPA